MSRSRELVGILVAAAVVTMPLTVILGVSALVSRWMYGDWTCALTHCVRVVP